MALFLVFVMMPVGVGALALEQGIFHRNLTAANIKNSYNTAIYAGFSKSLYKNSTVSLKVEGCRSGTFQLNWMIRYTECEGSHALTDADTKSTLGAIFQNPDSLFIGEKFTYYYQSSESQEVTYECTEGEISHYEPLPFESPEEWQIYKELAPTEAQMANDDKIPVKSGEAAMKDTGKTETKGDTGKSEKSTADNTTYNVINTILDGRYLFIVELKPVDGPDMSVSSMKIEVRMKSSKGYLSAFQCPLLPFYGVMCAVYSVLAFIWLLLLGYNWTQVRRVHFCIGVVLVMSLLEKAIFYAEFERLNTTGVAPGAIIFAELMSCLKRSLAGMLLIVVSLGYGITRPRLGKDLYLVMAAGGLYFILSAIEGCLRVKGDEDLALLAILPLFVLDLAVWIWMFRNLRDIIKQLKLRKNLTKLSLYQKLTATIALCVICDVIFLMWSTSTHRWTNCVTKWRGLWLDDAYWHTIFSILMIVIMLLVRPKSKDQGYNLFILPEGEDDDEQDEKSQQPTFNDAFDMVKMRANTAVEKTSSVTKYSDDVDDAFKYVDDNIQDAVIDAFLGASDVKTEQDALN